ncbi:MAG: hypothetical protein ACK53E_14425, partial [Pseudanabaena sp.]
SPNLNSQVPSPNSVIQPAAGITPPVPSVSSHSNQEDPPAPKQSRGYVVLSEEERIVRNMAEFFNGQIIDLDEETSDQGT